MRQPFLADKCTIRLEDKVRYDWKLMFLY